MARRSRALSALSTPTFPPAPARLRPLFGEYTPYTVTPPSSQGRSDADRLNFNFPEPPPLPPPRRPFDWKRDRWEW